MEVQTRIAADDASLWKQRLQKPAYRQKWNSPSNEANSESFAESVE